MLPLCIVICLVGPAPLRSFVTKMLHVGIWQLGGYRITPKKSVPYVTQVIIYRHEVLLL